MSFKIFNKKSNKTDSINNENKSSIAKQYKKRKFKMGGLATAITAVFVAIIVLINVILAVIDNSYSLDLDMTSDGSFSISEQTEEYLKSIDKPVSIKIFFDKDSFETGLQNVYGNDALKSAFESSVKINDNISLEYIDLNLTPNLASNYDTTNINNGYYIVFECGDKKQYLSDYDFYVFGTDAITGTYYDSNYQLVIDGDQIERMMVQKMLAVTSDETPIIAVVSGHNDVGITYFAHLAEQMGVEVQDISLITNDIPQDTKAVILPAPTTDYTKQEIDKLNQYLEKEGSGNIVFFGDSSQGVMPNLEAFLQEWGIGLKTGTLNEGNSANYISGSPDLFDTVLNTAIYSFASDLTGQPILSYKARPMELLFEENDGILAEAVLSSYPTVGILDDAGNIQEALSYPLITQSYTYDLGGSEEHFDCVYAYASTAIFDQSLLEYYSGAINNEALAQSMITTLTASEYNIDIPERNITSRVLDISQMQAIVIGLMIFVMFVPVIVLIIGFGLWFRRRRL